MLYVGIDVGSSYLKLWTEDAGGDVVLRESVRHRGAPGAIISLKLAPLSRQPLAVALSGNIHGRALEAWRVDGLTAEVAFLRQAGPRRRLMILGAEHIELVRFDAHGSILDYHANSACAAGTGSFLDEQLERLGITPAEVATLPLISDAPPIASRCAVFAKTDLIHHQQAGASREALYNGLCKGLVSSALKTLFEGGVPDGEDLLITGGLVENPHIRHFLRRTLPRAHLAEDATYSRARGLCHMARHAPQDTNTFLACLENLEPPSFEDTRNAPLQGARDFPTQDLARRKDACGNELWHDLACGERLALFLGVDIGSTSTKAVLMDPKGRIRMDIYRRTAGDPIAATRHLLDGIAALCRERSADCRIQGCATTGSGRKLIGEVIGADLIVNEITAHAAGACLTDPGVETIFEIGGQDAKFIRLADGHIADVNMNYVCAAGTGSFIEEQAITLGFKLDEIGKRCLGQVPLSNSDRCTVFMNQEVNRQLAGGQDRERIMAGVLMAVCRNYLNKVVGSRPYSRARLVFQGATARNHALVAAMESLTGARVHVSPFCHVTGALGAARLVQQRLKGKSTFTGLTLKEVTLTERICKGCENACRISMIKRNSQRISWGYLCGREPGAAKPTEKNPALTLRDTLLKGSAPPAPQGMRLLVPGIGLNEELTPLWNALAVASDLAIEVVTPPTSRLREEIEHLAAGDFCYPIKVCLAAAAALRRAHPEELILTPFLVQDLRDPRISPRSMYCPFITAWPAFLENARTVHAVIDLSQPLSSQARLFRQALQAAHLRVPRLSRIEQGFREGLAELKHYRRELTRQGRELCRERQAPVIVLVGRPYNLYHPILNLGLPELLGSLGISVIPMDILEDTVTNADVVARFPDMYWQQGQRILRKALTIARIPNFYPLFLTNFSCGPDSFIMTYCEEVSRGKPYMILELDEHGSVTGYGTRIEAFADMIAHHRADPAAAAPLRRRRILTDLEASPGRIWIPQMHPYTPQLFAGLLRSAGYDAQALGEETSAHCELGRSFCRGSECLPAALTAGAFLDRLDKSPAALFLPRSAGPCRFGQYATMIAGILDRTGHAQSGLISPSSGNAYTFLSHRMELLAARAVCVGDALYKLRCRVVPYHPAPESVEELCRLAADELAEGLFCGHDWRAYLRALTRRLTGEIDPQRPRRPLVGIVGEIFVRMNSFSNQHLVEVIEAAGGEAWMAPMSEWLFYVMELSGRQGLWARQKARLRHTLLHAIEGQALNLCAPLLDDRHEPPITEVLKVAGRYLPLAFEGEAVLTLGRAQRFAAGGAALIVNCAPFSCLPGRITAHLFRLHPEICGVPVVNLFFDGTCDVASRVQVYLQSPNGRSLAQNASFTRPPAFPGTQTISRSAGHHPGERGGTPPTPTNRRQERR